MVGRKGRRTPGVRHHVVSLLLFLVLLGGSIGLIGFAQAEQGAFPGVRVPVAGFELPERRVGDVWSYRLVERNADALETAERFDQPNDIWFNLTWDEPRVVVDGESRLRDANVLSMYDGWYNATFVTHVDALTERLVGTGWGGEQVSPEQPFYLDALRSTVKASEFHYQPYRAAPSVPCLASKYWDGPLEDDARFTLPMCWPHGSFGLKPATFGAAAAYEVDDVRYVVFDREDLQRSGIDRLVFREDLPYPVEFVHGRRAADEPSYDAVDRYRLVAFEAGQAPLAGGRSGLPTLPPLSMGQGTWLGIPDQGVDHPFPWSEAFQAAVDHPEEDAVRDFLDRHPDAVVETTVFTVGHSDGDTTYQWSFHLTADGEALGYCYVLRYGLLQPILPLGLPPVPDIYVSCPAVRTHDGPLPASDVPAPTGESLLAAWDAYRGVLGLPDEVPGYTIHRWGNHTSYRVGIDVIEESETGLLTAPVQPYNHTSERHVMWFDATGRLTSINFGAWDAGLHVDPAATNPTAAVTATTPSVDVPVWKFPAVDLVLFGTLVALFLTLVYWLLPLVKHIPLAAMFSRIQRDVVLDHAVRSAILEAVQQEPGIHDRELQRRVDVARGALQHHVRKLLEHGLIVRRREGGFVRYWPPEGTERTVPLDGTAKRVHELLAEQPGLSQSEVARRLGVSRQAVGKHVVRLRAAGMLPAH